MIKLENSKKIVKSLKLLNKNKSRGSFWKVKRRKKGKKER